jgi:23S rRNA (cytidine2498-2'-O)-methyltransferase
MKRGGAGARRHGKAQRGGQTQTQGRQAEGTRRGQTPRKSTRRDDQPDAARRGHGHSAAKRQRNAGAPHHGERGAKGPQRERGHAAPALPPAGPSIDPRQLEQALQARAPLRAGEWLWTMREGAERDLIEELLLAAPGGSLRPRRLDAALVASADAPPLQEGRLDVTFARQGFKVLRVAQQREVADLVTDLQPALAAQLADQPRHALHVFVPDSAHANELSTRAEALRSGLELSLDANSPEPMERLDDAQLRRHGGLYAQVCVYDDRTAALGCGASTQALSLWPGGRARMRLGGDFPSRAARKLAEAFAWLGIAPGSGELCVDLGAAPGGWSWLLLEKRARVIAVDPARMDPKLMQNPRLRHVQGSAFEYTPEEPVDWLFCDMAWRPLEVAQMLGRWARRRQTRLLVANFKLPMKRKVEMVQRLRQVLAHSGFTSIRTRQLYHDREEITLTAHVR